MEEASIQINCPECDQQYTVESHFRGRDVECGTCSHHFLVPTLTDDDDQAIEESIEEPGTSTESPGERFYPGAKKQELLKSFNKTAATPLEPVTFQTAAYQDEPPKLEVIAQPSPKRTIGLIAGTGTLLFLLGIFAISGSDGQPLKEVQQQSRIIIALFFALIGAALIIISARRKVRATSVALLLGGSLAAMPFLFPYAGITQSSGTAISSTSEQAWLEKQQQEEAIEKYKHGLGFSRLDNARQTAPEGTQVFGIALLNCHGLEKTIQNYILRASQGKERPIIYGSQRHINGQPASLLVLSSKTLTLPELSTIASKMGNVRATHDSLGIIEVVINRRIVGGFPIKVLTDENHRDFYAANYSELDHIDPERQLDAVRRLKQVSALGMRADMVVRLLTLLEAPDTSLTLKGEIMSTLLQWTLPEDNASERIITVIQKTLETENDIPESMPHYLITHQVADSHELLAKIWARSPVELQDIMLDGGELSEKALIVALTTIEDDQSRLAAAAILRKIGSKASLPALKQAMALSTGDVQSSLKATIDVIKSRQ